MTMQSHVFPIFKVDLGEACGYPHPKRCVRYPKALDQIVHHELMTTQYVPYHTEREFEWVYTFDLDHEVLLVDNYIHFQLRDFVRAHWSNTIRNVKFKGRRNEPYVQGTAIPRHSLVKLDLRTQSNANVPRIPARGNRVIRRARMKKARGFSSIPVRVQPLAIFLKCVWNAFLRQSFSMSLARMPSTLGPDDFVFRETAFAMIAIARGLRRTLTSGREEVWKIGGPRGDTPWGAPYVSSDCRHFAATLASGYHESAFGPGYAPHESSHWLDDVIVHLTTGLRHDRKVIAGIQAATDFGRATRPRRHKYETLLFSIQHIVLAYVCDGTVERSQTMTLFDVDGPYTKYPVRERQLRTFQNPTVRQRGT